MRSRRRSVADGLRRVLHDRVRLPALSFRTRTRLRNWRWELSRAARRRLEDAGVLRDRRTGVGSHGSFRRALDRLVRRGGALLLLDVDGMLCINDDLGHLVGDDVLAEIGLRLIGPGGWNRTYRIGGDEFAVLLPGATAADARDTAQRIIDALDRPIRVRFGNPIGPVRVAIALAIAADDGMTGDSLREAAARAIDNYRLALHGWSNDRQHWIGRSAVLDVSTGAGAPGGSRQQVVST